MALPEQFLEELSSRTDLVETISRYVQLERRGNRFFGRCPFHNEKSASFCVTPEREMFYCFGCHNGGGVFHFIMQIENFSFFEAASMLAERVGMSMPEGDFAVDRVSRARLIEVNRMAARWFFDNLSKPDGIGFIKYLEFRNIIPAIAKQFGLGAAPDKFDSLVKFMRSQHVKDEELIEVGLISPSKTGAYIDAFRNRLIFPIFDVRGKVIAFSGRAINSDSQMKYKNSPETVLYAKRKTLYGLSFAKNSDSSFFILVEGNIDVVMLHQAGFDMTVATCGTAITSEQVNLLARYKQEIIVCYDADSAGLKATQKAIKLIDEAGLKARVLRMPDGMDPDDYIRKFGKNEFETLLERSEGHVEYRLQVLQANYNLEIDGEKVSFLRDSTKLLVTLGSEGERYIYAGKVALLAGVSRDAVIQDVKREFRKRVRFAEKKQENDIVYPKNTLNKCEELVVSALLHDGQMIEYVSDKISPDDFSQEVLKSIYINILNGASIESQSPEEMSVRARLLHSENGMLTKNALFECVQKVVEQSAVRNALSIGQDPLLTKWAISKKTKGVTFENASEDKENGK